MIPGTEQEAAEMVRALDSIQVVGSGSKGAFLEEDAGEQICTSGLRGIVEWSPEDLVVVVRSGTPVRELQKELASRNQTLHVPPGSDGIEELTAGLPGTLGGMVSAALPTRWDGWSGGVRYWVLGLRAVRSDGTVIKCGSKAVKNVAGYDVQKLLIGAWGSLGLITEVILRVSPLRSDPPEDLVSEGDWMGAPPFIIARPPVSTAKDYARSLECPFVLDRATGTIWANCPASVDAPGDGWIIRPGPTHETADFARGIKDAFDPGRKFISGRLRFA